MIPGFPQMMHRGEVVFEEVQSLPAMTSNTAPSGHVASASTELDGYPAWKAFDQINTINEAWITALFSPNNSWIQRQTPSAITVWKYRVAVFSAVTSRAPREFEMQGSDNGSSWTTLDYRPNETGWSSSGLEIREYEIGGTPVPYLYHRLFVVQNNGDTSYTFINELELLQVR